MSDPTYPCPVCNRYACRCAEPAVQELPEQRQPDDWTPWWRAFASNA
jgi:hypothetical protein